MGLNGIQLCLINEFQGFNADYSLDAASSQSVRTTSPNGPIAVLLVGRVRLGYDLHGKCAGTMEEKSGNACKISTNKFL